MITQHIFENREDWMKLRQTMFTASQIHRLMAKPKGDAELSEGAITYIMERYCNIHAEPKPEFYNNAMQWGNDTEPEAVSRYLSDMGKWVTDEDVIYTSDGGTVFFEWDKKLGCTPDLILSDRIAQFKCPDSVTHLKYRKFIKTAEDLQKFEPAYYDQIQVEMFLTEKELCDFVSYDPRFTGANIHIVPVPYDRLRMAEIMAKVEIADAYFNSL